MYLPIIIKNVGGIDSLYIRTYVWLRNFSKNILRTKNAILRGEKCIFFIRYLPYIFTWPWGQSPFFLNQTLLQYKWSLCLQLHASRSFRWPCNKTSSLGKHLSRLVPQQKKWKERVLWSLRFFSRSSSTLAHTIVKKLRYLNVVFPALFQENLVINLFLHFLNFSVPPRIKPKPEDGNIVVKKGTEVNLECTASGNPVPTITWDKQVLMNSNFLKKYCSY